MFSFTQDEVKRGYAKRETARGFVYVCTFRPNFNFADEASMANWVATQDRSKWAGYVIELIDEDSPGEPIPDDDSQGNTE